MPGKVYVIGVGMTKFEKPGSRADFDYPDMTKEAVTKALADAKMKYNEIQQACVGYVYGDSTCGQRALYPLGMTGIPIYNVNNNCSTGSSALFLAQQLVAGGIADCVLALGFEKMERGSLMSKYDDRTNPMDRHVEVLADTVGLSAGPITAQMFGAAAAEHMTKYGTKAIHLAKIAHKNHKHSKNNPNSQFQKGFSLQEIIDAPVVAEAGPLTKLQCCPTSDGAAAVILASEEFVKKNGLEKQAVEIVGMEMSTDLSSSFEQKSCMNMVGYDMTCKAAERLYTKTGVRPTDISVVECHDCFSGNELLVYSALQLCKPDETGAFIDRNDNTYGGKYVVNPSGGLIAKGHPLGATGLAQCCELSWQLRGEAGPRQVPNVKFALQHNIGLGGAVVLAIYKKGFTDNKKMPSNDTNNNSDEFKSAAVIRQFAEALKADGARLVQKVKGVFAFKVKNGPGGKEAVWIVDAKNGNGSVSFEGKGPSPDVTLVIADSDLSDLLTGKAQPQKLFFQGKLKVQGNMGLAMKLQDLQKEVDAVIKPKSKL